METRLGETDVKYSKVIWYTILDYPIHLNNFLQQSDKL